MGESIMKIRGAHGLMRFVVNVWETTTHHVGRARFDRLPTTVGVVLVATVGDQVHHVVGVGQHGLNDLGTGGIGKDFGRAPAGRQRTVLDLVDRINAQFAFTVFGGP